MRAGANRRSWLRLNTTPNAAVRRFAWNGKFLWHGVKHRLATRHAACWQKRPRRRLHQMISLLMCFSGRQLTTFSRKRPGTRQERIFPAALVSSAACMHIADNHHITRQVAAPTKKAVIYWKEEGISIWPMASRKTKSIWGYLLSREEHENRTPESS